MVVFWLFFSQKIHIFSVKALLTTLSQVITALGMREEYLGCYLEAFIKNQLSFSRWKLSSCLFSSGFFPAQEEFIFRQKTQGLIHAVKQQPWLCRALSQQAFHCTDR